MFASRSEVIRSGFSIRIIIIEIIAVVRRSLAETETTPFPLFRFPTRARRPDHLPHNVDSDDTGDRDLLESRRVSAGRYDRSIYGRAHERPRANLYPDTKRAEWHQEERTAGHVRSHLESHVRSAMPTYVRDLCAAFIAIT